MKVSKNIENFLNFYDAVKRDYDTAFEMVNQCDKLTQDLLHRLELESLSTGEKNKIATQLKYCRKDRRYWKDIVEETESFVNMFNQTEASLSDGKKKAEVEANRRFINMLREALGKTRRQEGYHANRSYKPRIILPKE
jgi:prephenate dehydrogenase